MSNWWKAITDCWTWLMASVGVVVGLVVLIVVAIITSFFEGAPIIFAAIVLLALVVTYPLWKAWALHHPTANTGVGVSLLTGVVITILLTLTGHALAPADLKVMGAAMGYVVGAAAGVFTGVAVWNKGVHLIPPYKRVVAMWLFEIEDPYAMTEEQLNELLTKGRAKVVEIGSKLAWLFPFFMSYLEFDMKERTLNLPEIKVELKDGSVVRVKPSIQWIVQPGQLLFFGNVEEIEEAMKNDASKAAAALAVSCNDIHELEEAQPRQAFETVIYQYVNQRANGKITEVRVERVVDDKGQVRFEPDFPPVIDMVTKEPQRARPWGVDIISAPIIDFNLPENYTDAAAEIAEATAREAASKKLDETMINSIKRYKDVGVDPNLAMAQAHAVNMPDRPNPTKGTVIPGLAEGLQAVGAGVGEVAKSLNRTKTT